MDRNLFIDYDGTLIDSRRRQYELFVELAGNVDISLKQYWYDKRKGMKQSDMLKKYLNFTTEEISDFSSLWMKSIEDSERLKADELIAGVPEFLDGVKRHFNLHLVTGRQNHEFLIRQMQALEVYGYFASILNTAQCISKSNLICAHVKVGKEDVIIGDSEEDVLAGKELKIYTVAVTSGATSYEKLKELTPNLILESVAECDLLALNVC